MTDDDRQPDLRRVRAVAAQLESARLLDVEPDDYHKRKGLSSGIATTLLARSPLHAWCEHPAYGGVDEDEPTAPMDLGSVVHTLTLGKGRRFKVLDYKDWRTNAAKEARDDARKDRMVPILAEMFDRAQETAAQVHARLEKHGISLTGTSEQAFEWHEESESGPVLCRGMADHVWPNGVMLDLKITENAAPSAIERNAENLGYAVQRAAYVRAMERIRPELAGRIDFLFAFCEPKQPFAISIVRGDGMFRELGERRWKRAVEVWGACVKANHWPAYEGIGAISVPGWALAKEEPL